MRKTALLIYGLLLLPVWAAEPAAAEDAAVPEPFKSYTLADQHGEEHTLQPETRIVIMSFEMPLAKAIHEWLAGKDPDYLAQHQAEYVVDISPMPGFVTKLFAGPKMRKYKFPIIQARADGFANDYRHEEGRISVFMLSDDQASATVTYVKSTAEIEALLEPAEEP